MQMYSEADVDTSTLIDRQVTILGYGSQGRAHALNLRDSGFNVVVGLRRDGASWAQAEADGLTVKEPVDSVKGAAIVAFLTPDMVQKSLYGQVVDAIGAVCAPNPFQETVEAFDLGEEGCIGEVSVDDTH